ncbi:Ig-like domain-containing protein [Jatrophihabitans sp. DSM 45814]
MTATRGRSRVTKTVALLVVMAGLLLGLPGVANATLHVLTPDAATPSTFIGHGGYSADGLGQDGTGGTIQAEVPAGSTVVQAYLYGSYSSAPLDLPLDERTFDFDGSTVVLTTLANSEPAMTGLITARATVTDQVAAKVGSGGGITNFAVNTDPDELDGVALVVIYSNPALPLVTVAVLDGGSKQAGDRVTLNFDSPVDTSSAGFAAQLSLGSGFSFQGPDEVHECGGQQFSTVDVNGSRLTSCAGNYDDGVAANGALITVGGVGDSLDNPTDPNSQTGTDDELYNLTPFIHTGDKSMVVQTANPSGDDNLFLAVISVTARASVTTEVCDNDIDDDGDGLIDKADPDCNLAPTAASQSVSTPQDTAVPVTLAGADPDGDAITYAASNPAHGSLSGTAPNLTYTPSAGFSGTDSFTFTTNDGKLSSPTATVSITVTPVNHAPTAADQSLSMLQDTSAPVTLVGDDRDGDAITYNVSDPAHGTLSGTAPNLTYTPDAGYRGADSFTFTTNDGKLTSPPATVSITVTPVNHPPTAAGQSLSTLQDTPASVTLTGTDPDGDALNYAVSSPAHGALSGTAPNLIYTPNPGYRGPDSFTFTTNDGDLTSSPATVSITVTPVNHPPTAAGQAVTTAQDVAVPVILAGDDPDGDAITYSVSNPAHGTLSGTAPQLTYTPDAGYSGADSFTFTTNDGKLPSAPATIAITVTAAPPVNHAPTATNQSVSTLQDTATSLTLTGADPDGDAISYAATQPAHGTLSGTAPNLTYTPDAGFSGPDAFTFTTNDGSLTSPPATVSITVTAVNHPPTASDKAVSTPQDAAVAVTLAGADPDGDAINYVVSTPSHGTLSGIAPELTYTPDAGFSGADSFTFTTSDGTLSSAPATVSITVVPAPPVNHAPTAADQAVTTQQDQPVAVTLVGSDADGDPITYTASDPGHGTLSGTAPNLTYTPDAGYSGSDSFTFTTSDGTLSSAQATVSISITPVAPVNHRPTANSQTVTTLQGKSVPVTLVGTDPDGDRLTYLVSRPAHGKLTGSAPNLTYTPNAYFHGADHFSFRTSDGALRSSSATVSITVSVPVPVDCTTPPPTLDTVVSGDSPGRIARLVSPELSTAHDGELVLAFVTADGPLFANQHVTAVSGAGLTWTRAARSTASWGTTEVWQAYAPKQLSDEAITARLAKSNFDGSITVAAFSDAATAIGASDSDSGFWESPRATVKPNSRNSLIWAAGHNWSSARPVTAAAGQSIVHQFVDRRVGDTFWTQRVDGATDAKKHPVTLKASGPLWDFWSLTAVEIPPALG